LYARRNPLEDFAETYREYILNGDEFRKRAQKDRVLREKYDFLKKQFFYDRVEFGKITGYTEYTKEGDKIIMLVVPAGSESTEADRGSFNLPDMLSMVSGRLKRVLSEAKQVLNSI
jgi:hypothetical protein